MRAMVLAAGLGTRFRPLSDVLAKPAAPVLGEPLIRHTLRRLRDAGVRDVIVNVHHRPGDVVRACRDFRGLRVRFQRERRILGTGGGVRRAQPFFRGETAIVWNGDVIFDLDLAEALAFHRRRRALATMVLRRSPEVRRYGAVEVDRRGRVVRLLGEPRGRRPGRALMFTGVHLLEPAFFRELSTEPSCIVRTAYRSLVDRGAGVYGFETEARWLDLGTPADYLRANLELLGERVLVGAGARIGTSARIARSVVGAGARVGSRAAVERCVLWPGAEVPEGGRAVGEVVVPVTRSDIA